MDKSRKDPQQKHDGSDLNPKQSKHM